MATTTILQDAGGAEKVAALSEMEMNAAIEVDKVYKELEQRRRALETEKLNLQQMKLVYAQKSALCDDLNAKCHGASASLQCVQEKLTGSMEELTAFEKVRIEAGRFKVNNALLQRVSSFKTGECRQYVKVIVSEEKDTQAKLQEKRQVLKANIEELRRQRQQVRQNAAEIQKQRAQLCTYETFNLPEKRAELHQLRAKLEKTMANIVRQKKQRRVKTTP